MNVNLPAIPTGSSGITALGVQQIEAAVAERVPLIDDIELLNEWRAQAAALETYLRSRELQRPMLGAQRRVEARIGQLLGDANETNGKPLSHAIKALDRANDRLDFRILARGFDTKLDGDDWRKSRRALVALLRQRLGLIPETPPLPAGQFSCIVADPPWRLDTGPDVFNGTGESGHDSLAYSQMSLDHIRALPVENKAADDAHLYLWTTNRYVEHAYGIVRDWGFRPSVLLVWCKKPRGVGLGDAFRLTTEFCLYARRGGLKESRICPTTWFEWPRGKHSQKPAQFYQLVESMSPAGDGGRLDMFTRSKRAGWVPWGHEVPDAG